MSNDKPDQYGIEPPGEPGSANGNQAPEGDRAASKSSFDAGSRPTQFDLEPVEPVIPPAASSVTAAPTPQPARSSVKDLDVCPNCGASMTGSDALVCVRCGFDLKTMKVVKTMTGETVAAPESVEEHAALPLVQPGVGDLWLPAAMAGISGLIMLICYLAGARGLFPELKSLAEIGLGIRVEALLKFIVFIGVWTACGLAALAFMAYLLGMKLVKEVADFKLAAARMLGIVATMSLAGLIDLKYWTLEFITEAILRLAIGIGLSILLFKLKPRDGVTLTGVSLVVFMLLWVGTFVVQWATTGIAIQR